MVQGQDFGVGQAGEGRATLASSSSLTPHTFSHGLSDPSTTDSAPPLGRKNSSASQLRDEAYLLSPITPGHAHVARQHVLLVGPRALEDDVERLAVVHVEAEARAVAHVAFRREGHLDGFRGPLVRGRVVL